MRRGDIFWGGILIILGGLFLLQANHMISDVFGWFWPLFFVLLGVWILVGRYLPGMNVDSGEQFTIDLQGATQVAFDLDHGAGTVRLTGGAPSGVAVTGTQATGMDTHSHLSGDRLEVKLEAGPSFIPFLGPDSGTWLIQLTQDVPLTLDVDSGASRLDFDLTDLKVTHLSVDTGASSLDLKLPAQAGNTLVDIESGAATLDLSVPQGVAARVRTRQGASSIQIDQTRFPLRDTGLYQSADYDTAANKVEINLSGGANTVNVR
jgi:hypothetical protein